MILRFSRRQIKFFHADILALPLTYLVVIAKLVFREDLCAKQATICKNSCQKWIAGSLRPTSSTYAIRV